MRAEWDGGYCISRFHTIKPFDMIQSIFLYRFKFNGLRFSEPYCRNMGSLKYGWENRNKVPRVLFTITSLCKIYGE